MEHEGDNYTNHDWCFWYSHQRIIKGTGGLEVGEWVEIIQTTTLLRTGRILRRVQKTCCHSNFSERPSAKTDVKNSQGINNDNNNTNNDNNYYNSVH